MTLPLDSTLTPIMQQYWSVKNQYPTTWVFFQLGDFFELFYEDAKEASRFLDLTLTHRGTTPMAGIPVHTLEGYLKRLLSLGKSAVLCEQIGQPDGKGPMERGVTRVYTPGTVYENEFLDSWTSNYLLCAQKSPQGLSLSWIDFCEGIVWWMEGDVPTMLSQIATLQPKEILSPRGLESLWASEKISASLTTLESWYFQIDENKPYIYKALPDWGNYQDREMSTEMWGTIGALIRYGLMHIGSNRVFRRICQAAWADRLDVDMQTRQHLHIVPDGPHKGLLGILDYTLTPGGSRYIQRILREPTRNLVELNARYDAIEAWNSRRDLLIGCREHLSEILDLERLLTKLATKKIRPREVIALKRSLEGVRKIRSLLVGSPLELGSPELYENNLISAISERIVEEPAQTIRDGKVIAPSVCAEYGKLVDLLENQEEHLAQYALSEQENSGVPIKAGMNSVQGFYLEVTKSHSVRVPEHFIRVQTLKSCERYHTAELRKIEQAVLTARSAVNNKQIALWDNSLDVFSTGIEELLFLSQEISRLDCTHSLAYASQRSHTVRPQFCKERQLCIRGGRHPILERKMNGSFVANDCYLNHDAHRFMLLTGPNMGGKSTYMRQVALIVYMAHVGAFVPAASVVLGPIDKILTRIGAHDKIEDNQSTFMVELTETARILRQATAYSLVLIDEMGRGTSTYDGLSIASATAEEIHNHNSSFCLFSTHYHELSDLSNRLPCLKAFCFGGEVSQQSIAFSYTLMPGAIEQSFGLYVAHQAGLPKRLLERAWSIHETLVRSGSEESRERNPIAQPSALVQKDLSSPLHWDLDSMSPRQAWLALEEWQKTNQALQNFEKKGECTESE